MAGGQGTRFWPESRRKMPKQYLALTGNETLIGQTLTRFEGLVELDNRYVITIREQGELVVEASGDALNKSNIIFEPSGRNTAPCILLSLATLIKNGAHGDDIISIVPSDHVILNTKGFQKSLMRARDLASENSQIVTIGIPPNFPNTGYGYIQRGKTVTDRIYTVEAFKEKPDFDTAKSYVESGEYFWNAGMFVAKISTLLEEFETHAPSIYSHYEELLGAIGSERLDSVYSKMQSDSIDYAIMEKSKRVSVIEAEFDWNDLGSWDALELVCEKRDGSVVFDKYSDAYQEDCSGNIIFAPNQFVSTIGLKDFIVVSSDGALLILPKKDAQKVKSVVGYIKERSFSEELL